MEEKTKELKELEEAKAFIDKILKKCEGKNFIFRGTSETFSNGSDGVSSQIYRKHTEKNKNTEYTFHGHFNPIDIEKVIVERAKRLFPENTSTIEILTELRHFGGKTTLIDFSKSFYAALFFVCTGELEKNGESIIGELILLDTDKIPRGEINYKNDDKKEKIVEPALTQITQRRVLAQSSIFVHAPKGYIDEKFLSIESVPVHLKNSILYILDKYHNIKTNTIYNDLIGFIADEENFESAEAEFYKGLSFYERKKYPEAVNCYDKAIRLNRDFAEAYYNRGNANSN